MSITCFAKYNYDPITELRRQTNTEERDIEYIMRDCKHKIWYFLKISFEDDTWWHSEMQLLPFLKIVNGLFSASSASGRNENYKLFCSHYFRIVK